ncbi:hypothetical protein HanRHA438_Chr16g0780731 [Helianthus annuus]|nr:hypothetical protein HanRHA438_Chr16g0780731 [Helianthus annuus]
MGKRKQTDAEAEGQPSKKVQRKKITRKGNLDAFISESSPKVEKVVSSRIVDSAGDPRTPETIAYEEEKTAEEILASTFSPKPSDVMPERVEKVTVEE